MILSFEENNDMKRTAVNNIVRYQWRDYWPDITRTPVVARFWQYHKNFQPHSHEFIELVLIVGGRGVHRSCLGDQIFSRGDVFILRPGAWHAYYNIRQQLRAYNLTLGPELLRHELAWALQDESLGRLLCASILSPRKGGVMTCKIPEEFLAPCIGALEQLRALGEQDNPQHRALRIGLLLQALAHISPHLAQTHTTSRVHPAVLEVIHLMQSDLAHDWSLPEMAEALGVDASYLVRIFHKAMGLPPIAYLLRLRAERAAALLAESSAPVSQIGTAVGWESPAYFARRFQAHFGMSASEYRKRFQMP